ncbi:PREDICTED: ABC transporter G family member 20-like isoform X2 [Vollenhovia emeryi]|uniref:ABC transporter G family member 20-like isoform X2 n=1 Tax=Vollenhovia emeryi TaxID=411798 RepID=UPI0005F38DD1|nr:PREDICTED: ABC transporter G family member 20-like isoform X2 [Vollenhovia emeryi]
MLQQNMVVVKNAVKRYGKEELVLDGLNMTVSNGSIYVLLGASGCGKTTLLSCIIGARYFDSGEMWVLGGSPGSIGCGIPGPPVGYMPQDISLAEYVSTSDALYYFGRINGLDDKEIETRHRFFSELFQLPPTNQLMKNMSGGQRRRVSLVAALMHKPKLLILDEPTVGLDPLLRENIWAYLIKLTQEEGTTILITTHYIEEAKKANKVGFMRHGKLLAESTPQKLLEQFQCSSFEEIFLKLCEAQNNAVTLTEAQGSNMEDAGSDAFNHDQDKYEQLKESERVSKRQVSRLRRFKALFVKNSIQLTHDYSIPFFVLFMPIFYLSILLLAIGGDPKNLKIGIVNNEAGNCEYGSNVGNIWNDETTCYFGNLSCKFLNNFDNSIATQKYYDNISEAKYDVQRGKLHGIIYFHQNFSEALQIRVENVTFAKDFHLLASQIQVFLDMSEGPIGYFLQNNLFQWFLEIFKATMKDCKYLTKLASPPIRFEDPIGTTDLKYIDFVIPTYLPLFAFFLATTISCIVIITERLDGIWNRSLVQVFPIWGLECRGSIFTAFVLVFLNGFCGLCYGFVISTFCTSLFTAIFSAAGSWLSMFFLNGEL